MKCLPTLYCHGDVVAPNSSVLCCPTEVCDLPEDLPASATAETGAHNFPHLQCCRAFVSTTFVTFSSLVVTQVVGPLVSYVVSGCRDQKLMRTCCFNSLWLKISLNTYPACCRWGPPQWAQCVGAPRGQGCLGQEARAPSWAGSSCTPTATALTGRCAPSHPKKPSMSCG